MPNTARIELWTTEDPYCRRPRIASEVRSALFTSWCALGRLLSFTTMVDVSPHDQGPWFELRGWVGGTSSGRQGHRCSDAKSFISGAACPRRCATCSFAVLSRQHHPRDRRRFPSSFFVFFFSPLFHRLPFPFFLALLAGSWAAPVPPVTSPRSASSSSTTRTVPSSVTSAAPSGRVTSSPSWSGSVRPGGSDKYPSLCFRSAVRGSCRGFATLARVPARRMAETRETGAAGMAAFRFVRRAKKPSVRG